MAINGYTVTQRKLLRVLSDGQPHSYAELFECLPDADGAKIEYKTGINALQNHVSRLREMLRDHHEYIVCEAIGYKKHYRHVRLLNPIFDEVDSKSSSSSKRLA